MAITPRVDQKRSYGAVGLFFGRYGGQFDDNVRLLHNLLEGGNGVVGSGVVTLEELARCHHDLVGGFATATASSHAIGYDGQHTPVDARVFQERDLILLVLAVAFVGSGGSGESITSGHVGLLG